MLYKDKLEAKTTGLWPKLRGDRTSQSKRYHKKYPERRKAYKSVARALKNGIIVKPVICDNCQQELKLLAHHKDYSKPLEVLWLCQDCHNSTHGRNKKE